MCPKVAASSLWAILSMKDFLGILSLWIAGEACFFVCFFCFFKYLLFFSFFQVFFVFLFVCFFKYLLESVCIRWKAVSLHWGTRCPVSSSKMGILAGLLFFLFHFALLANLLRNNLHYCFQSDKNKRKAHGCSWFILDLSRGAEGVHRQRGVDLSS